MFAVFRFDAGVKVSPVIQLKTANICYDLHCFQRLPPDQHRTMTQSRRIHIWGRDETVQLFHGIVIIYDGKDIRHATSIPFDKRYTRFGIFHGSTNPRGYKKYAPEHDDR